MTIRRLLYITELESPAYESLESLMVLRDVGLEEVLLLFPGGAEEWKAGGPDYGIQLKSITGDGPLLTRVKQAVQKEEISVIAAYLERRHRKGGGRLAMRNLMRSSPSAVIFMNENALASSATDKGLFHHIVFATDWSPVSRRALEYLVLNFRPLIKMLEIVNVVNKRLSVRDIRILRKKLAETRKVFLDMGIDAESHIYAGKTPEEILLAAKDYEATTIAMGTSGRSSLMEMFSGSYSYRVAEEAEVPVLLVP
jgi:nucleotide-binding universal stress UspA family protein